MPPVALVVGTAPGAPSPTRRAAVALPVALLGVLPLWFLLVGSLRPSGVPASGLAALLPADVTLDAYRSLPELLPLWTYLRNSALVVGVAVPLTVLVAAWAGYGVRLLPPRGRRAAVLVALAVMSVPAAALWTGRSELYGAAGALGGLEAVVAPALLGTTPFFVLVYAWAFAGVPDDVLAAARLEGASEWRVWRAVALPLVRPATFAVGVLAFTAHWGGFLDALLYLRGQESFPLALGLQTLLLLNPTEFPLLLAGAVVLTVPSVVLLLLAQRVFLDDRALQRALR